MGGGIQVANSFLKYSLFSKDIRFIYLLSRKVYESLPKTDEVKDAEIHIITTNHFTLLPWHHSIREIREIERNFSPDFTFTLFGPAYWKSKAPHLVGFARPHYILHHSPFYKVASNKKLIRYMYLLEAIHNFLFRKNSDYLFVENESMVQTLKSKYGKDVFYVPNTYNQVFEQFSPRISKSLGSVFQLLTISSDYPHKNLDSIPLVAAALLKKYPDFKFRFVVTVAEDSLKQSSENIKYIGPVTIEKCPELYLESDAMYLPTLLECFSASYVEAMYMGLPVLTSDLDFARSICGSAAAYFDPLNAEDIAETIYNLATNPSKIEEIVDAGKMRLPLFGTPQDRYMRFVKLFHEIKTRL